MKKLVRILIVVLIATFALGVAGCKKKEGKPGPVVMVPKTKVVVASVRGKVYHSLRCPDAMKIKLKNRITYPSRKAARAAGRMPHGCTR